MLPVVITGTAPPSSLESPFDSGSSMSSAPHDVPPFESTFNTVTARMDERWGSITGGIDSISSFSWDITAFGVLLIGCFLLGLAFGRSRLTAFILASYAALGIYFTLSSLVVEMFPMTRLVVFIILLAVAFVLVGRAVCRRPRASGIDRHAASIALMSVALSGFLVSTVLSFVIPDSPLRESFIAPAFASFEARLVWSVFPVIAIALFRKRHVS